MNSSKEYEHQLAFAERQFFIYQARVNLAIFEGKPEVARNYIGHMSDCNDTIDELRRKLDEFRGNSSVDENNQPL
jgi:hypothetical protein